MPRAFHSGTAEQVVATVEAVVALSNEASLARVAEFTDLREDTARAALALAGDVGLLDSTQDNLRVSNPICHLLRTPSDKQKAAVIRIVLESYEPFLIFREELQASGDVTTAANRTKARLELTAHREDVKSTILGLATYSGALIAGQGTQYQRDNESFSSLILELAAGAADHAAAIHEIREQIGNDGANVTSHDNVISPLAAALRQAAAGSAREAVVNAGNAVETFLQEYAARHATDLAGANGINAKIDRLKTAGHLPTKLSFNGKYLGHIRNAADHGVDAEVQNAWDISRATGLNYVLVATAFLRAVRAFETGQHVI